MKRGLYYLALPYTGTQTEQDDRKALSLQASVNFLQQGIHVFAPLIYVNTIIDALHLPSRDERRTIVMPYLFEFLKVSQGLILCTAEGWQTSWGVREELRFCEEMTIPVYLLTPEQLSEDLSAHLTTPLDKEQLRKLLQSYEL